MKEKIILDPEDYYIDLNSIGSLEWNAEDLIGRRDVLQVLRGAFPTIDNKGQFYNFYLCPKRSYKTMSSAFLFTGAEGNGKHTLDLAFAMEMLEKCDEEEIEFQYYSIPGENMKGKNKDETAERIEALFENLIELCNGAEGVIIYISLGNLTEILKHKKTAKILANQVEILLGIQDRVCIVTGYFHKSSGDLPYCVQKTLTVLELEAPNEAQRVAYFDKIRELNPAVRWEMSLQDMAKTTEGFTFQMLQHTVQQIYLWAMGCLGRKHSVNDLIAYVVNSTKESFLVPKNIISFIIENVKKEIKTKKAVAMPTTYGSMTQPLPVEQMTQSTKNPTAEKSEADEEEELKKQLKSSKINTTYELKFIFNSLRPLIQLQVQDKIKNNEQQNETSQRIEAQQS